MTETAFSIIETITIFSFGVFLSFAFAGIQYTKKNICIMAGFSLLCSIAVLLANTLPSQIISWCILPLLVHIPNVLLLVMYYYKRFSTAFSSVCTSYLLCQPPRWIYSMLAVIVPENVALRLCILLGLFILTYLFAFYLSQYISGLFNKDAKSVYIFGSVPIFYYAINYFLEIKTNFWSISAPMITEFFRFLVCIVFLLFCVVYYKEYEQKADLDLKEQIINISFEQQKKEMELIKEREQEIRIIRHDMRLFLNTLIMHIHQDDKDAALKLATTLVSNIEATTIQHYSNNNIVNYILSDYAAKFEKASIPFHATVELQELRTDEIVFASILSNALDNALNATSTLPTEKRNIKLLIKNANGKLLLSVRNSFQGKIIFSDGLPVSSKAGHGYGTRSIRYMTEKTGGNCQFTIEDNEFVLRVVI